MSGDREREEERERGRERESEEERERGRERERKREREAVWHWECEKAVRQTSVRERDRERTRESPNVIPMFNGGRSFTPAVRPDVGLKSSPITIKSCPKNSHSTFYSKSAVFKIAPILTKYFGFFWKKICQQEFSKIAQSGHTDSPQPFYLHIEPSSDHFTNGKIIFCVVETTYLSPISLWQWTNPIFFSIKKVPSFNFLSRQTLNDKVSWILKYLLLCLTT